MGDLSDVDPVRIARAWLLQRPVVTAALGGPDRVGPYNEPPYPRVVLTDPPGDDRDMLHLIAPLLQIEVLGDFDGSTGKPMLRKIMYKVLAELREIPSRPVEAGDPVITNVASSAGVGWSPLGNGQPRYVTTVRMHGHPSASIA